MSTLTFERFDRTGRWKRYTPVVEVLEKVYRTRGMCTHIGFPSNTGEIVFVFPLKDGERFMAVVPEMELLYIMDHGDIDGGVDEYFVTFTNRELEAGITTRLSLL